MSLMTVGNLYLSNWDRPRRGMFILKEEIGGSQIRRSTKIMPSEPAPDKLLALEHSCNSRNQFSRRVRLYYVARCADV